MNAYSLQSDSMDPFRLTTSKALLNTESASLHKVDASGDDRLLEIVRTNDLALHYWSILDYQNAENLLSQSLTLLLKHCRDTPLNQTNHWKRGAATTTMVAKVNVGNSDRTETIGSTRPYEQAFLLYPMESCVKRGPVELIAAVVFFNIGLFYHLQVGCGSVSHPDQALRYHLIQKYYGKADVLLGRFMDASRVSLWTFQAAIWHNLTEIEIGQSQFRDTDVYMSQLEAFVGWVDDIDDRRFFAQSICRARNLRLSSE